MPLAYIFDMDGTMVDNMGFHSTAWIRAFQEHGHELDTDEFTRVMGGRTATSLIKQYVSADLSPEDVDRLIEHKEIIYRDLYRPHMRPAPGLMEFLQTCQARNSRLAVASSARKGNIDFVLDGLGLRKFFDIVLGAEDVTHAKPDPEMFLKAAHAVNVPPRDCWVFEDAPAGLDAAHAAGMPAVLVAFDAEILKLAPHPAVVRVIRDFTEL